MKDILRIALSLVVAAGCFDDDETGPGPTTGSGGTTATGGGGTGGTTATGGGGTGAQGGSTGDCSGTGCEVCFTCMIAPGGGCVAEEQACAADCQSYIECIEPCIEGGGDISCIDACIAQHPTGAEQHRDRASCVLCSDECSEPCATLAQIYHPAIDCT